MENSDTCKRGEGYFTSDRCCLMRKVICKNVTAGGRYDFFLDFALYTSCFSLGRIQTRSKHVVGTDEIVVYAVDCKL